MILIGIIVILRMCLGDFKLISLIGILTGIIYCDFEPASLIGILTDIIVNLRMGLGDFELASLIAILIGIDCDFDWR